MRAMVLELYRTRMFISQAVTKGMRFSRVRELGLVTRLTNHRENSLTRLSRNFRT